MSFSFNLFYVVLFYSFSCSKKYLVVNLVAIYQSSDTKSKIIVTNIKKIVCSNSDNFFEDFDITWMAYLILSLADKIKLILHQYWLSIIDVAHCRSVSCFKQLHQTLENEQWQKINVHSVISREILLMSCMCVFKLFLRDDLRDFVNLSNLALATSLKKSVKMV